MELIQLTPQLHFIQFPVGHAYLWHDPDGLTLIDTGLPGSAPHISAAIHQVGHQNADVRRLVLTHFHPDHIGAAADIAGRGDVEVIAHHADAPFIRAQAAGPPPDLADWERPLYDQVTGQATSEVAQQPPAPPRIDRELGDGDELGFGDGAVAVAVPGHTPGSVAIYLPRHQVLFTGDAAARTPDGTVMGGVFNVNRAQAAASFRRLAGLDVAVACFGHGDPLTDDATAALRSAAERLPADTGNAHPGALHKVSTVARVIFMCGPAGSGKSTVARQYERQGMTRLSFDQEAWSRGITAMPLPDDVHRDIEASLRARLEDLVRAGSDVVLDFSFWSRRLRDDYRDLLRPFGVVPETVYLATDRATVLRRLSDRAAGHGDDFQLSAELAAEYFDHFEPPTDAEGPLTVLT